MRDTGGVTPHIRTRRLVARNARSLLSFTVDGSSDRPCVLSLPKLPSVKRNSSDYRILGQTAECMERFTYHKW